MADEIDPLKLKTKTKSRLDEAESASLAGSQTASAAPTLSAGAKYDPNYSADAAEARMKKLKAAELPPLTTGAPKPKKGLLSIFD